MAQKLWHLSPAGANRQQPCCHEGESSLLRPGPRHGPPIATSNLQAGWAQLDRRQSPGQHGCRPLTAEDGPV